MGSMFSANAVCISCTDRVRTENFYQDVLGATVVRGDEPTCRWFRIGDATITVVPNAERPMPREIFPEQAMAYLMLETDDLEAAREHCREHGVPIVEWHEEQFMIVEDPDGLPIEVWQREADAS